MNDVPIRRLMVSDFRRLEGTRELPFDAPVVLIHGSNGTGKTSVLSALELALTGEIRSMERQSDRYKAHLPFLGKPYAKVRADVAKHLQSERPGIPLSVNGARLEGTPAFNAGAAKFYAERCYLDQSSMGRLLDLYQAREGNEKSALEKFVSELLGLEKLDALRSGLGDANDFRLFRKLAVGVDEADREAKLASTQLREQTALGAEVRMEVANARAATREAFAGLDHGWTVDGSDDDLLELVRTKLNDDTTHADSAAAVARHKELIAFGGRVSALAERPTAQRIEETRVALTAATADVETWEATDGPRVRDWEATARAAGVSLRSERRIAVEHAMNLVNQELEGDSAARVRAESTGKQLFTDRVELDLLQERLADAHEYSSALVEGLDTLRRLIDESNMCPVCDRDFSETGSHSLLTHVDTKLAELTNHGQRLFNLRDERDQLAARVSQLENEHTRLTGRLLSGDQQRSLEQRRATLAKLAAQVEGIESAKSVRASLNGHLLELQQTLDNLEAATQEERHISSELTRYADLLGVEVAPTFNNFEKVASELIEIAEARVAHLAARARQYRTLSFEADRLSTALGREGVVVNRLVELIERKKEWDDRVTEAKRRQKVANEVNEAAARARTDIVHRVFTETLNEVWKTVFTRLAPNEGFIPSFGIPNATKKTFDIKLETTHRNGEAGGPPQMMLSAGNLNTAALSLFLALHLAVEPSVPCLVFDDPVQAMDEVHVAQFAGLVRLLSKQNGRQVIIAVHERELFDYLSLELSPAYEGDELITIELGERAAEEDRGITRHRWVPDIAVAD